jgi:hypothetical protein
MRLLLLLLLLLLLPVSLAPGYTACVPLRYGADCSGECACAEYEDCDDGVTGSGACSCSFGRESTCGIPSRLVPPPAGPPPPCVTRSDGSTRCRLEEVVLEPISGRLRLDRETSRSPRRVANATLVPVLPTPLHAARLRLVASDSAVAELLGLDPASWLAAPGRALFTELFTGRQLFPGSVPYSHVYGGHQFGSWSGKLAAATSLQHVAALQHGRF